MNSIVLLNKINVIPRWIIFTIDLVISFLSLTFAYAIEYNFDFSNLNFHDFILNGIIACFLSAIIFFGFKTYAGIIRFTSAQDSLRILSAVIIGSCLFSLIDIAFFLLFKKNLNLRQYHHYQRFNCLFTNGYLPDTG